MLGAVPGALYRSSSLFSTNDIVQDAQIDLARLSKALHSKQNDYDRTHPRRDAKRQLQLARATVQELEQDDIEKDIICDVQVARRSSKSALGDSATRLLQIEDQVKRGTIGTKRTLGSLHRRLAALDRAIADKVASDDGYVKFARRQTKQEHRVVALETQMSASNVKLSTLRMEMRTLKTSLEDLTHSNQILTSTLVKLGQQREARRDDIVNVFKAIDETVSAENGARQMVAALMATSDKLEQVCDAEWRHLLTVVREKESIEETLRRYRRGEKDAPSLALVDPNAATSVDELERVCSIWAQATWSNAIDQVKVEEGGRWLAKRQADWQRICAETGINSAGDQLCQWFQDRERANIVQFDEIYALTAFIKQATADDDANADCRGGHGAGKPSKRAVVSELQGEIASSESCIRELEQQWRDGTTMWETLKVELDGVLRRVFGQVVPDQETVLEMLARLETWTNEIIREVRGYRPPDDEHTDDNADALMITIGSLPEITSARSDDDDEQQHNHPIT
ncbi:unnamed protein product (mitochondrion) [Plasmodiophora brassicae]|uniref:Uncharacterized protein n=1 Tax=Plasmodiophora brassicae TaxID=37360 RepID=A0A0G4IU46_PLABS|nr:hypothetical protein PBRA_006773 [Plasmodiophora brassicae]SPR00797.1 unnamed protein product [Plasmodiophora brassicae]